MTHRPQRCTQHQDYHAGCQPCRAYAAWYFRTRQRLVQAGQWTGMVDSAEARQHATNLIDAGMRRLHIAERAGINVDTIAELLDGRRPIIYPDTAAAILGVRVELRPHSYLPAAGSSRRVQALVWQGRTRAWIAGEADVALGTIRLLADERLDRVLVLTHNRVAALFRQHAGQPAPDTREARAARRQATRNGWHGLGAWDDIDDPDEQPNVGGRGEDLVDEVAVAEVAAGRMPFSALRDAEKVVLFRDHLAGWTFNPTMALLGVSARTVKAWRARAAAESGQVAA
ncbi:hypothetical protein ACFFX1_54750 [Dactylosporangium sucinum]|uniref:Uncharacterized protein n=1 Tax=Dactylosporangium sucinum TaxID=1424081 RepID=A0A917X0D0_9ACTN|nr:hypothetical protein [Dactylosporangium sucinum]GGM53672.1 hypothetical protein GCM10007977_064080 [Dactylosporangium sucinum]